MYQLLHPVRKGTIMSFSPVRLNHAVLFVADLQRSLTFYTELFGMEVVATEPRANAAFLRLPRSGNHHDLGLFGVGAAGGPKMRGSMSSPPHVRISFEPEHAPASRAMGQRRVSTVLTPMATSSS
jgi:catechol 2,3-dioxygenase-like lactoylglutathione lyase family enzyme